MYKRLIVTRVLKYVKRVEGDVKHSRGEMVPVVRSYSQTHQMRWDLATL